MPWLSILMAVLGFILSKKNGASDAQAALVGAGAGLLTYGVTHHTDWGQQNLGHLDGWEDPALASVPLVFDESGNEVVIGTGTHYRDEAGSLIPIPIGSPNNGPVTVPAPGAPSTGIGSWLTSNLPSLATGGAVGAAVAGLPTWVFLAGGALILYMVLKD